MDDEIKEYKEKKSLGDNLTKEERKAFNEMIHWEDVIIRPYDKGKGFTIEDRTTYINSVMDELNNTAVFEKVQREGIVEHINARIKAWADKYHHEIGPKLGEWMVDNNADLGYIYQNRKAHKPGRTITSGCGSATERLSQWLQYNL